MVGGDNRRQYLDSQGNVGDGPPRQGRIGREHYQRDEAAGRDDYHRS